MDRSLEELRLRAAAVLRLGEPERGRFISVAREKSPSASFDLAMLICREIGREGMAAIALAKACRWLAVIRRDHGAAFDQICGGGS